MNKENLLGWMFLLLSFVIGVLIGMILMYSMVYISTENIISNILSHIQIENINFDLNETAFVEAINQTIVK